MIRSDFDRPSRKWSSKPASRCRISFPIAACFCLLLGIPAATAFAQRSPQSIELQPGAGPAACKRSDAGRILGGSNASIKDWPGFVAFRAINANGEIRYFCGGSAIAPDLVLTAAHCVDRWQQDSRGEWLLPRHGSIELVFGTDDITGVSRPMVRRVAVRMIHEGWTGSSKNGNDIALLRIQSTWPGDLARISVSPVSDAAPRALAAGFGLLADPSSGGDAAGWESPEGRVQAGSKKLQEVLLPVVSAEKCAKANAALNGTTQLCAGFDVGGKDSCQGDSGGPLSAVDAGGCPYQIGIVSFGDGCGRKSAYGVYTRVSAFADWMRQRTGSSALGRDAITPEAAGVASSEALDTLLDRLGSSRTLLDVRITPSSRLRIGQRLTIEVTSGVTGTLLLIDENARKEITQIHPNRQTAAGAVKLGGNTPATLPPPGANYSFQALPPSGRGRLIAVVVPPGVSMDKPVAGQSMLARSLAAETQPASYAINLAQQLLAGSRANTDGAKRASAQEGSTGWAAGVLEYTVDP